MRRIRAYLAKFKHKAFDLSGDTLVSVIAAFAILMIGMGMLSGSVAAAWNLTNKAEQTRADLSALLEKYALEADSAETDSSGNEASCGEFGFSYDVKKITDEASGLSIYWFAPV